MRLLLAIFPFFIPFTLFSQIDIKNIEGYRELVFNVRTQDNGLGAGFIVGKNESHYFLATAKHVINGNHQAVLTSLDGEQYNATLLAEHDVHDLALLQTPLFSLRSDKVPIVTDIVMNDEVGFVSLKDRGKVLPSKGAGIVRDVTGESLSIIMKEVEQGHSGSPLISKDGIAGVIIKNGRFIECLNITLVQEIVEGWGESLFESVFVEMKSERRDLVAPKTAANQEEGRLPVMEIKSDKNMINLARLIDGNLGNVWSGSVTAGEGMDVQVTFHRLVSVRQIKIYVSDGLSELLPRGYISLADGDRTVYAYFLATLKYKERYRNGHWLVYELPRPELATKVIMYFHAGGSKGISYYFNEIEFHGIAL